jgi:hypothetical protein
MTIERTDRSLLRPFGLVALATALALGACSDDADPTAPVDDDPPPAEPTSAILIAERFWTPDGRVMFMGAFGELPTTPIQTSQLVELGPAGKAFACAGHAFFFDQEAGSIRKFIVEDDLSLTEAGSIQITQEGVEGFTAAHVCADSTRAYTFARDGTRAVEWSPEEMVIVDAFDLPAPVLDAGLTPGFFEPYIAGDLVYFPVEAVDWTSIEANDQAIVATFDLTDESLTFTYRDECASGNAGFVADDGTFYREQSWATFFATYGPGDTPDCVLRILPGQKTFDPDYVLEAGPTQNMFPVDEDYALALLIDESQPIPAADDLWSWWSHPLVPTLVDRESGETSPYAGIPPRAPVNLRTLTLDGMQLYQINERDAEGRITRTDVVELTPTGPSDPVFTLEGGDVLALERIR